jgi:hypothetical protein
MTGSSCGRVSVIASRPKINYTEQYFVTNRAFPAVCIPVGVADPADSKPIIHRRLVLNIRNPM